MRTSGILAIAPLLVSTACSVTMATTRSYRSAPGHAGLPPSPAGAQLDADLARMEQLDNTDEIFDCLRPGDCPTSYEQRAVHRAAAAWSCAATRVRATSRPTAGLDAPDHNLIMGPRGHAEYHATAGVVDAAFDVTGCDHEAIIACIPAHRMVATAQQTYDNTNDHLCIWATDSRQSR